MSFNTPITFESLPIDSKFKYNGVVYRKINDTTATTLFGLPKSIIINPLDIVLA